MPAEFPFKVTLHVNVFSQGCLSEEKLTMQGWVREHPSESPAAALSHFASEEIQVWGDGLWSSDCSVLQALGSKVISA